MSLDSWWRSGLIGCAILFAGGTLAAAPQDLAIAPAGESARSVTGRFQGRFEERPFLAQATPRDSAFLAAVERGDVVSVAELLEAGADPDLRFADGDPLLLRAIKRNHGNVALALMSAGAKVSAADSFGWTPLMIAVLGGQDDLAAILLERQADPDRAADDGTTARSIAAMREQDELLALMDGGQAGPEPATAGVPADAPEQTAPERSESARAVEAEPRPVASEAGRPADPAADAPDPATPSADPVGNEVLEVQRRLAGLGYDPGPLDGASGPRTRGAIRAFQRDRGAAPDGIVSAELLRELRAAVPAAAARDPAETAWLALAESTDPADIAAYLRAYSDGPYAVQARARLRRLNAALWAPAPPGPSAVPGASAAARDAAWTPSRPEFADLERYLIERRELFHAQLNAYNKRHEVKPNANRSSFKVRDVYEIEVFAREGDSFRVMVLMGIGNWHGQSQNSDLNVERLVVVLRPSGDGFEIVGHSEDLAGLPPAR